MSFLISLHSIAAALHTGASIINGKPVASYTGGKVKCYRLDGGAKLLTQNPEKPSVYGFAARHGAKITWLLDKTGNYKGYFYNGKYYGKLLNPK